MNWDDGEPKHEDAIDLLRPAQGIINAVLLGCAFWVVAGVVALLAWSAGWLR